MTLGLLGFGLVLKPKNPITCARQVIELLGFETCPKPNNPITMPKPIRSTRFDSKPIIIRRLLGYWVLKPPPKPNNPTVEMKRLLTPLLDTVILYLYIYNYMPNIHLSLQILVFLQISL